MVMESIFPIGRKRIEMVARQFELLGKFRSNNSFRKKTRLYLIISHDVINNNLNTLIIAP